MPFLLACAMRRRSHRRCVAERWSLPECFWSLGLSAAALLLTGQAAFAGSITGSSIWNRQNALQRARDQMPSGVTVTRERCEEIGVGIGNYRYRCTVWFSPTPDPPSSSRPTPPGP